MANNEYLDYIMSPEWRKKSKDVQQMTFNHCIVFPWLKSNHAHHLTYRNLKREIPIRDIVPLSKAAHSIIHWRIFWKSQLRPWINFLLRLLMCFWVVFWLFFGEKKYGKIKN